MFPYAALLVLTGLVSAAVAQAQPGVVLDERRLTLELLLAAEGREQPMLVGVRGASSVRVERRVHQVRPEAALVFEDLASDDALAEQMALAMGRHGARCAVSLEPLADPSWRLRLWGECAPGSGVLPGPPVDTGTRVGRAVLDEQREPDRVAEQVALSITERPADDAPVPWTLEEGSGYPMSTLRFALQVGDLETVKQLERERRWGTGSSALLAATGGAAALGGLVAMGSGFTRAAGALQYGEQVRAEQVAWTGVVISAAGAMVLSGLPRLRRSLAQRRSEPSALYDREQAQALIEAYNRDVQRELGIDAPADDPEVAP